MLHLYDQNLTTEFKPLFFKTIHNKYNNDYKAYTDYVFSKSIFDKEDELISFLDNYKPKHYKKLLKDPAYNMAVETGTLYKTKFEKKKHKASRTRYKHAIFETTNIPYVQDSFVALRYLDWQRMQ